MRLLADPHLIQAIAAYRRGTELCFMFPWAPNGNLGQLWRGSSDPGSQKVRRWAWDQILGLTNGLARLHEKNTRHGDVKPENILRFNDSSGSQLGPLVIADVGIAKYHAIETEARMNEGKSTSTRSRTRRYAPPEIDFPDKDENGKVRVLSRRYDSWSLGCVLLEFIIWLNRGRNGLKDLDRLRNPENIDIDDSYWEKGDNASLTLKAAIDHYIEEFLGDSTLITDPQQDPLALVKRHLLDPVVAKRSTVSEFLGKLKEATKNCSEIPSYLWDDAKETLTQHREPTAVVDDTRMFPISQQVSHRVRTVKFVAD